MTPRVLGLIVNYNGGHWVVEAVASLLAQSFRIDILVVDNASSDGSGTELSRLYERNSTVRILHTGENPGPAAAYNKALEYPDYEYYFYLNPDALAPPTAVADLVRIAEQRPDLAIIGPLIVEHDRPDVVQESAPRLDLQLFTYDPYEQAPVSTVPSGLLPASYACAASMLVRGAPFRAVLGNDADFFMFADESDLMWRMRLIGFECAIATNVHVRHVGGLTATVGRENGFYQTSLRRMYLRELNCWRMGIKCFGPVRLICYFVLNFVLSALESAILFILGKHEMSKVYRDVLRTLWNERSSLVKKRRAVQRSRTVSDRIALATFYPGLAKLVALRRRGMPRIVAFSKKP